MLYAAISADSLNVESTGSFLHPSFHVAAHSTHLHYRRANAEEHLERVPQIGAIVSLETVRHIIKCELAPESYIDATPLHEIAHVADGIA